MPQGCTRSSKKCFDPLQVFL